MRTPGLLVAVLAFVPRVSTAQGAPVGPEFRVNTYTTSNQGWSLYSMGRPFVASDPSGDFVVVWNSYLQDGSDFGIFGQRYSSSGAPLGPEFRVNTYTTSTQNWPSAAADSSGSFVVVWNSYQQDGSLLGVFGQRYASGGAPLGPEFRVNSYTTEHQARPSVAAGPSGNFVVVWMSVGQDGSGLGVFGQRYDGDGAPLGPEFRVNTYTTSDQAYPSIAADSVGNFVVVWSSYLQDGSGSGVFGQRYASTGAPIGPEFRVNTYTTSTQTIPTVASDSSGNFVVVWYAFLSGGQTDVFGQRYSSSGAPVGPEFRVNTYTTDTQVTPSITADSSGNFVVVWASDTQDGSADGVFGQRYLSSGAPLGPEFRVNTYTTGYQLTPSIAADSSGNFVVVWTSGFGQDGSGFGVFGQRYGEIVPVELMRFQVE